MICSRWAFKRGSASVRGIALILTAFTLVVTQLYVSYNQVFDITTLGVGVVLPLVAGSFLLLVTGQKVLFLAYFGYFWSIVDDAPVYLDSVFTWPEVTRFHPALPHYALKIAFHVLTLVFMYLSIRGALRLMHSARAQALGMVAFVLSYAQNIPLDAIQSYVESSWYQLDIVEHVASLVFFGLALYVVRISTAPPARPST